MTSQSNHFVLRNLATASLCLATLAAACPPSAVLGQTVHLVVAADTTEASGLGGDVIADKAGIRQLFESHIPSGQLRVKTIEPVDLTPDGLLNTVGELQVEQRRDAVVFYYTGHGAFDDKVGHFFSLPGGKELLRSRLEQAIIRKEPRTAVTITDCCAGGARFRGALKPIRVPVKVPQISPLFQHLLLDRSGLVSVTSSKPGEISLTRGDGKGSLFTYPFVNFVSGHANERLSWDEIVKQVGDQVRKDFDQVTKGKGVEYPGKDGTTIHQDTQTVHAFVITPALGLRVKAENGGLLITEVLPLSPAYHAGLEVGDTLLEINGVPIRTEQQYSEAVDTSSPTMRLKVRDHRRPQVAEVKAMLNQ